jgi:hypothetical protein
MLVQKACNCFFLCQICEQVTNAVLLRENFISQEAFYVSIFNIVPCNSNANDKNIVRHFCYRRNLRSFAGPSE